MTGKGDPKKALTHYPQRVQLQEGDANGLVVLFSAGENLERSEHASYYLNRETWLKLAHVLIEHFEGSTQIRVDPKRIN